MKATEVLEIFENFIDYRYTPSDEGVKFGCDCGCGGDYYSRHPEDWDRAHEEVYKARKQMAELLVKLNIENDLKELGGINDNRN